MSDQKGVTITLSMQFKPEAVEPFIAQVREMVKETLTRPGFQEIELVQHRDDPTRMLFMEKWDCEEAYHAYLAWRQERGDWGDFDQILVATQYDVWSNAIVPHVKAVRGPGSEYIEGSLKTPFKMPGGSV